MTQDEAVAIYQKLTQAHPQVVVDSLVALGKEGDQFITWADSLEQGTLVLQKTEKEVQLAKVQAELSAIEVKIK